MQANWRFVRRFNRTDIVLTHPRNCWAVREPRAGDVFGANCRLATINRWMRQSAASPRCNHDLSLSRLHAAFAKFFYHLLHRALFIQNDVSPGNRVETAPSQIFRSTGRYRMIPPQPWRGGGMAADERVEADSMSVHNGQRKSVHPSPRLGYYLVTLRAGISTRRNKAGETSSCCSLYSAQLRVRSPAITWRRTRNCNALREN